MRVVSITSPAFVTNPLSPPNHKFFMKTLLTTIIAALLPIVVFSATPAIEPVILNEQGVKNLGLETVTVEEADFELTTFALGRTEAIPEKRSILSSRIPGRVAETNLKIGAYVEKGEKLVLLESRQPGDPPPSIWLTAPASGTIISVNTSLGAPVEASDSLAEIADLSTIYLIATVPQATAGKIKQGSQAKVRFPIRPDKEYTASLLKFASCPCPDPACALGQNLSTRSDDDKVDLNTAGVVFTIENPDNQLRRGMNAECTIIMEKRDAVLSVPREAIQGSPSSRHVYVKHGTIANAFDRVYVTTGMTNGNRVEILDGLIPGDEVVTRGSYSLGFAGGGSGVSLKEAMDAAHGHDHNEDGSELTLEQKAAAAKGGKGDTHAQNEEGISMREMLLMISTGILAIVLVVVLLRRPSASETSELS
jgi:multidrug efflux pump subunit AcrA (membrane-fusion protein)